MNVNDLPQELLSKIREQFYATPKVKQMEVTRQMFLRNGNFKAALAMAQDIEVLYNKCVYEYMEENKEQVEQVEIAKAEMSIEDKEELMRRLLVCFMCADMIESSVIKMNDLLHKYDKHMYMEMFNDIREVMKLSEQKLKYLQENSGYMKDLAWADNCDNMYEMMLNKAGSIMRKRKNDPNWGEGKGKVEIYRATNN
jgi:hypothetical protein